MQHNDRSVPVLSTGERDPRRDGLLLRRDCESGVHHDDEVDAACSRVVDFVQLSAGDTRRSARGAQFRPWC